MSQRLSGEDLTQIQAYLDDGENIDHDEVRDLLADLDEARETITVITDATNALAARTARVESDLEEARAALREIVSIQIDTSLSPIDAANKMCRVAVDALAATEEIDG